MFPSGGRGRRRISKMSWQRSYAEYGPAGPSFEEDNAVGEPTGPSLEEDNAVGEPTEVPISPLIQINRSPGSLETAASEDYRPARLFPTFSPYPPAESTRDTDSRYRRENIRVAPEFLAEQSKRIAKVALDYYNKKKKIKFELLHVRPVNFVPTKWRPYMHINFVARSTKEGSKELLFFAELYLCGKKQTPSGYSVIVCEPLVDNSTPGLVGTEIPRNPPVRKNLDFAYCYACDHNMLHPKRGNYVGGHCNVPGIYKSVAML